MSFQTLESEKERSENRTFVGEIEKYS